jgi:hypothetical protein
MERDGIPKRKNPENYKDDVDFKKWVNELNKGLESFWEYI